MTEESKNDREAVKGIKQVIMSFVQTHTAIVYAAGLVLAVGLTASLCLTIGRQSGSGNQAGTNTNTPSASVVGLKELKIVNKAAFSETWYAGDANRRVRISCAPDSFNAGNINATVISSDPDVVQVDAENQLVLKAMNAGTAKITVKAGKKSDSFKVKIVKRTDPTLAFAYETEGLNILADTKTELPEVIATACDGRDLSDSVSVSSDDAGVTVDLEERTITVQTPGKYQLMFHVADPVDSSKTAQLKLNVTASRKVFGAYYSSNEKGFLTTTGAKDEEQITTVSNDQLFFAQFNAEPSKNYYAEVTFTSDVEARMLVGMTHSVKDDTSRWLTTYVGTDDLNGRWVVTRDVAVKDLADWSEWEEKHITYTQEKVAARRGIYNAKNAFPVKVGVARMDDFFYVFINDEYVAGYTSDYFGDTDTVPGIFGKNICCDTVLEDRNTKISKRAGTAMTEMKWLTGEEAEDKFDELTGRGSKIMSAHVPYDSRLESINTNNQRFKAGAYSSAKGANINYTYNQASPSKDGEISPYIYFDGDFEFEFTYRLRSYGKNGTDLLYAGHRLQVYVCPWDKPTVGEFDFGAYFYGKGKQTYLYSKNDKSDAFELDENKIPVNPITFKVTRIKDRYTVTITENCKNGQAIVDSFIGTSKPVQIRIDNVGIAGEYTNIKWSSLGTGASDSDLKQLTITNKKDLTKAWAVAGADREIKVRRVPDTFSTSNIEVVSSNPNVIQVSESNKFMLKAKGAGTATITVSAAGKSDSVEITVGERTDPTLKFVDEITSLDVMVGVKTMLPNVVATSCDGVDLNKYVTISTEASASNITLDTSERAVTAKAVGNYEVVFEVKDPADTTKKATLTLPVNASRKVFASTYTVEENTMFTVTGADADSQEATVNSDQIVFAQFNAEPAKKYYAEVTFTSDVEARMLIGMTHSVKGDETRWLTSYVDTGARTDGRYVKTLDVDVNDDNLEEWNNLAAYTQERIGARRNIYSTEKAFPVTVAVARMDDFFYVFINGEYVAGYTSEYFDSLDTVPGIFGKNICSSSVLEDRNTHEQKTAGTTMSNMKWLTGAAAEQKFNELTGTGSKIMSAHVPDDSRLESQNTGNRRFTVGAYTEEKGANINYTYNLAFPGSAGEISPYLYFDGDFEFEFTYKLNSYGMNDAGTNYKYGKHRLQAYVCPWDSPTNGLYEFGAYFYGNIPNPETYLYSGSNKSDAFALDENYIPVSPLTFKVTRTGTEYTVTITENSPTGKSITDTFTGTDKPVQIRIDNVGIAGEYTNIKWSAPESGEERPVYTVTFKQNGQDDVVRTVTKGGTLTDIPAPAAKEGYDVAWNRTNFANVTGNLTVNAVETAKSYTITYDLGGNSLANVSSTTQTVTYDENVTLATPATSDGAFDGWYLADENGDATETQMQDGIWRIAKDVTLIAKWSGLEPNITMQDNQTEFHLYNDEEIELPMTVVGVGENNESLSVTSSDETIIIRKDSNKYHLEATSVNIEDGQAGVSKPVTITVTDSRTGVSATQDITVNVYKPALKNVQSTSGTAKFQPGGSIESPTAKVDTNNLVLAQFAGAEASNLYYAEVTFTSEDQSTARLVGLTHSDEDASKWLVQYIGAYGKDGRQCISKYLSAESNLSGFDSATAYTLTSFDKYRDVYNEDNKFPVKVAVARVGNFFYVFVNDTYITGCTAENISSGNSVPGILLKNGNGVELTNMTWLTDDDAEEKFNALTDNGSKIMSAAVLKDGNVGAKNTDNQRFTTEYTAENGVSLNYIYNMGFPGSDGGVSPYLFFDGDFEFEFTYKLNSYGMNGSSYKYGDERLQIYLCKYDQLTWNEIKQFGAYFYGNNKNTYLYSGSNKSAAFTLDSETKLPVNTITFKVTRSNGSVTVSATENCTDGKTITETFNNTDPLFIRMENIGIAGTYTNIKWSSGTNSLTSFSIEPVIAEPANNSVIVPQPAATQEGTSGTSTTQPTGTEQGTSSTGATQPTGTEQGTGGTSETQSTGAEQGTSGTSETQSTTTESVNGGTSTTQSAASNTKPATTE